MPRFNMCYETQDAILERVHAVIQDDSKLLSGNLWFINVNPDNNLESLCINLKIKLSLLLIKHRSM
jgi:hypothetical protein